VDEVYYKAVDQMEKLGVCREYMLGWIGGYLGNPTIEEQRSSEGYEAGYADGEGRETGNFETWAKGS